jgi:ribose/xylose/arabinose/galactoside ABC-type transport system permease subunit
MTHQGTASRLRSSTPRGLLTSQRIVDNALLLGLLTLAAFFAFQSEHFLSISNFQNIAENVSVLSVVVVASTMLLIAGHIDLSVGSTVGLTATITGLAVADWGWPAAAAIAAAILVGAAVGLINGTLCALAGFNPIIVTLGMLGAVRGFTLLINNLPIFGLGEPFRTIGAGDAAGVPVLTIFAAAAFVLGAVFLALTPWGRHIYAIGVNPTAAFLSGLSVRKLPLLLYVATGASAGLAGVLFASRLDGVSPGDTGIGLEIDVLTAILLGGVAFAGGRGNLFGVFIAVILLGVLQNGLLLMNVEPFVQLLVQGLALVIAAGLEVVAGRLATSATTRRDRALASDAAETAATPPPVP